MGKRRNHLALGQASRGGVGQHLCPCLQKEYPGVQGSVGTCVVHMQPVGPEQSWSSDSQTSVEAPENIHKDEGGDSLVAQKFRVHQSLVIKKRNQQHFADAHLPLADERGVDTFLQPLGSLHPHVRIIQVQPTFIHCDN